MNYNRNDYVIVNGKKYFSLGGNVGQDEIEKTLINPEAIKSYIKKRYKNKQNFSFGEDSGYTPDTQTKSKEHGMNMFMEYSPFAQKMILNGRKAWSDYLYDMYDSTDGRKKLEQAGISLEDIDNFTKATENAYEKDSNNNYLYDFDDTNHQNINRFMGSNFKKMIHHNNGDEKYEQLIPSGDNIYYSQMMAGLSNSRSEMIDDDWKQLNEWGLDSNTKEENGERKWWGMRTITDKNDPNYGSRIYAFYRNIDKNGNNYTPYYLVRDKDGKWFNISTQYEQDSMNNQIYNVDEYDGGKLKPSTMQGQYGYADIIKGDRKNLTFKPNSVVYYNDEGDKYTFDKDEAKREGYNNSTTLGNVWRARYAKSHAFGGRLYAAGGSMGQIPMGEQDDYNYVDAGGSHEQNPMGGVPYGYNDDGSQNMVEEGEVSVGNNVYSDRSTISPELCQQLGLPEGTTHAAAMQQIEQLYEQKQISDEEYQEISDIIFQDQEAQKENRGMSYQQGQVGQAGAQPEGMDGSMGMMQNEGIDPAAVNAYGYGGTFNRWDGFQNYRR